MKCVNVNHPEFQSLSKALDISIGQLRNIVQEFQNTYNTDSYPSTGYIRDALYQNPNIVSSQAQVDYWNSQYSTPSTLDTWEEVQQYKDEAERYFYKGSVSIKETRNGKYQVSVQRPIFEGKVVRGTKIILDDTLISTLYERADDSPYGQVFKQAVEVLQNNNIPINITVDSSLGGIAAMEQGKTQANLTINKDRLSAFLMSKERSKAREELQRVISHELIHSITSAIVETHPSWASVRNFNEAQTKFNQDIDEIFEAAKKALKGEEFYGLTNRKEFVSEVLTNRDFQLRLAQIQSIGKTTLWNRIVNAFAQMFKSLGFDISNTLLEDALTVTQEYIDYASDNWHTNVDDFFGTDKMGLSTNQARNVGRSQLYKMIESQPKSEDFEIIKSSAVRGTGNNFELRAKVDKNKVLTIDGKQLALGSEMLPYAQQFVNQIAKQLGIDPQNFTIDQWNRDKKTWHIYPNTDHIKNNVDFFGEDRSRATLGETTKKYVTEKSSVKEQFPNISTTYAEVQKAFNEIVDLVTKFDGEVLGEGHFGDYNVNLTKDRAVQLAKQGYSVVIEEDYATLEEVQNSDEQALKDAWGTTGYTVERDKFIEQYLSKNYPEVLKLINESDILDREDILIPDLLLNPSYLEEFFDWTYDDSRQLSIDFQDLPATVSQQKVVDQEKLDQYKEIPQQPTIQDEENIKFANESQEQLEAVDNLCRDNILKKSEVRKVAEKVVYAISDLLTQIEQEEGASSEIAARINSQLRGQSLLGLNRREIAEKIGISNLFTYVKETHFGQMRREAIDDFEVLDKMDLIYDNFEGIKFLATDVFANVESFGVRGETIVEDQNINADNFEPDEQNDTEQIQELHGSLQEHWQQEFRTIDVLNNMTGLMRQALTSCYKLDENGNKVEDEYGIAERINAREATNSILRWTQGSLTLQQMIDKLTEKAKSEYWVSQLLDRLNNQDGKEADFQSQFFSTFLKHFQLYSVVNKKKGIYSTMIVNEHPALSDAVKSVSSLYQIGEHPLFTSDGKVNLSAVTKLEESTKSLKTTIEANRFASLDLDDLANTIGFISSQLGYPAAPTDIKNTLSESVVRNMINILEYTARNLREGSKEQGYNPFAYGKSRNSIRGNIQGFLTPITQHLEDINVSSFYDSGKMYQSYVTPSYLTKLMQKFSQDRASFEDFVESEYGRTEWFRDADGNWRNKWLELMMKNDKYKDMFAHKVSLNFNKHNYMRNMTDAEYTLSVLAEYFESGSTESMAPAWFRIPMMSNKPSSEFIKFVSYRGSALVTLDGSTTRVPSYQKNLVDNFKMIFDQELSRIQTVILRNKDGKDPAAIKNFDGKRGRQFCFLDFFNDYLKSDNKTELGRLLKAKLNGESIDENRLNILAKLKIYNYMSERANNILTKWQNANIVEGAKAIKNIGQDAYPKLLNFIWNDTFASMQILQLTITDTAFYKDAEDLQKRLAQIHAPGIRGNSAAIDYQGNKVSSDGKHRTIYLTDFDKVVSNVIDNIKIVFDKKIEAAPESMKAQYKALQESIISSFSDINVADAQAYSSPTSYRKKAFVFGRWSRDAESVYNRLQSGNYSFTDLKMAFQPLKPFVYSRITKSTQNEDAPIKNLSVPIQHKNSEYLLMMADAILQNENTGRPNLLRAIYRVMEESAYDIVDGKRVYNGKGIDTVQFESAVKSGLQGRIDLKPYKDTLEGEAPQETEAKAKKFLESCIYTDQNTKTYNDQVFVHEVPFEDYSIQQEVPAHFQDHSQAHGSQTRMIIPSDLNPNIKYNVEGRELSAREFRTEYENTIAQNISTSIENLQKELHLTGNRKDKNAALARILQREIISSPRYGIDLLQACSIDQRGNFRIPLGDPIQSKRVEQLINSIIKNRVNKQEIAGGPVVQVSNFGTSRELNIVFNDKQGNPLLTKKQYEQNPQEGKTYEQYLKENQAGISHLEVFAPIYNKELFEKFADENGIIDVNAINSIDPKLLEMVGYRIPTEDKYSIAPLKIVGFLPREAGDGIMLPNDITILTGSDFDVDKEYLMRYEYDNIRKKPFKEIKDAMWKQLTADYVSKKGQMSVEMSYKYRDALKNFLIDPQARIKEMQEAKVWDKLDSYLARLYRQNAYTVEWPSTSKVTGRNNKIVSMTREVLNKESIAEQMLNPGGFDPQKKMGYMVEAKRLNPSLKWDYLKKLSINDLKDLCYTDKNLSFIDTHVQFYKQNSAAATILGIFAVAKVAHAVLEGDGLTLDVDRESGRIVGTESIKTLYPPITLMGKTFRGMMEFDRTVDDEGNMIGKTLGSLVASAADAVKDPILNLMNINSNTVNILNTLIRFGVPFEKASLFLSQKIITDVLSRYTSRRVTESITLNDVIDTTLNDIKQRSGYRDDSEVIGENISEEELVNGIVENNENTVFKVLKAYQFFSKMANAIKGPSFATRFNSISNAVGPLIIDNLAIRYKMSQFSQNIYGKVGLRPMSMNDIFRMHPILQQFAQTVPIAEDIFKVMPAGSNNFKNILDGLSDTLQKKLYGDRKTLSQFVDFYSSYQLIASDAIKEDRLKDVIQNFPQEFIKNKYQQKYKDNKFIQSIRLDFINQDEEGKNGRPILKINTTGLDSTEKQNLMDSWEDLHRQNPELSTKLFEYCFFRGGIGFNPKTFMSLVPTYVKENIEGYNETFRNLYDLGTGDIFDQFVQNNVGNNKLVPTQKELKVMPTKKEKTTFTIEQDIKALKNTPYFKTVLNNETILWKRMSEGTNGSGKITSYVYAPIPIKGNNGEYLEISMQENSEPIEIPITSDFMEEESDLMEPAIEEEDIPTETEIPETDTLDLYYQIMGYKGYTKEQEQQFKEVVSQSQKTEDYFKGVLEEYKIPYDDSILQKLKDILCEHG